MGCNALQETGKGMLGIYVGTIFRQEGSMAGSRHMLPHISRQFPP